MGFRSLFGGQEMSENDNKVENKKLDNVEKEKKSDSSDDSNKEKLNISDSNKKFDCSDNSADNGDDGKTKLESSPDKTPQQAFRDRYKVNPDDMNKEKLNLDSHRSIENNDDIRGNQGRNRGNELER